jgi:hypothetical protein
MVQYNPSISFHPNVSHISSLSSTFVSLRHTTAEPSSDLVRLTFVTADEDILDCSAVGSGNQIFYEISTEYQKNMPMVMTFARLDGTQFARVEWEPILFAETNHLSHKWKIADWISELRQ